jgi:DNA (cytosine-5)-methyltransferase 1
MSSIPGTLSAAEQLPKNANSVEVTIVRSAYLRPARSLIELRDRVLSRGLESHRTPDPVRASASAAGREVARNLDKYWRASEACPSGAIDVIDMFSGCGGMSAGFRAFNGLIPAYKLAMAIDIEPVANASYRRNFGIEPVAESVAALARNKSLLRSVVERSGRRASNPLVLIGCAPCQGFSSHRNAAGRGDKRNSLFVDFAKVATFLEPDAIVMENVPELLTTSYWPILEDARAILVRAGYRVYVGIHNMAEFGVPQERFRAVVLAMRHAFQPPAALYRRQQFRTVRQAIESLPPISAGERRSNDVMHYTASHRPSTIKTIRAVPKDGGNRPRGAGPACLRRMEERQGKAGYEDVYGRLRWDEPSITITAYARNPASGRFVHPEQDRGLSIREAALLQGFPGGFTFVGSLDDGFRQVGNAVPPIFSSYLAGYILGEMLGPLPRERQTSGIIAPVGSSFSRMIPGLKASSRVSGDLTLEALQASS